MEKQIDLKRLRDFFRPEDIEWKPVTTSKKKGAQGDNGRGLAAAYVTARAIMDRLDEVCGPENWKNEFKPGPDGGVLCTIYIRVRRADGSEEWIGKTDGAENTDIEAVKGGLSGSMRRAAVQWGIARYLYDLPQQWVPLDERGRFAQTPSIPRAFLPEGYASDGRPSDGRSSGATTQRPGSGPSEPPVQPSNGQRRQVAPRGGTRGPDRWPGDDFYRPG